MKQTKPYIGLFLIVAGTLTLMLTRVVATAAHNWLLLTGLLLIVAGIIAHIKSIKHDSRY